MWDGTGSQIEFLMIRHGATKGNERHAYIGVTEEPLSEEGLCVLKQRKPLFTEKQVDRVYTSPLGRCLETAGILFPRQQLLVCQELRETDFGEFEGKNYEELSGNPAYQSWIASNGELPFPKGESRQQASERTMRGMVRILEETRNCPERLRRVAAIVHGGTIMTVLSTLYGGDYYAYQVKNAEGFQCVMIKEQGKYRIKEMKKIG